MELYKSRVHQHSDWLTATWWRPSACEVSDIRNYKKILALWKWWCLHQFSVILQCWKNPLWLSSSGKPPWTWGSKIYRKWGLHFLTLSNAVCKSYHSFHITVRKYIYSWLEELFINIIIWSTVSKTWKRIHVLFFFFFSLSILYTIKHNCTVVYPSKHTSYKHAQCCYFVKLQIYIYY